MLFRNRKCESCERRVSKEWAFCPGCGASLKGGRGVIWSPFGSLFRGSGFSFGREARTMQKMLEQAAKMQARGFQRAGAPGMKMGGMMISITAGTGAPKIAVRTFGDAAAKTPREPEAAEEKKRGIFRKARKEPKEVIEPKVEETRSGKTVTYLIFLPGARPEDVSVQRLESSIEIRAPAGERMFFKILEAPESARVSHEFSRGVLKVEVEE